MFAELFTQHAKRLYKKMSVIRVMSSYCIRIAKVKINQCIHTVSSWIMSGLLLFIHVFYSTGIKHGLSCINIRQVPWEVLKTEAEGRGFQHLPRDLANVNALKNHVRSLLLHKN